jgi:hypothetical protein
LKNSKTGLLCLLMTLLPACGQQLVEFPAPGASAGGDAAAAPPPPPPPGAENPDARSDGAGNHDAAKSEAGSAALADAALIDVALPADGGLIDVALLADGGLVDVALLADGGLVDVALLADGGLIDVALLADTGLVDAGKLDSATSDAALVDGGLADTGNSDAHIRDGGPCTQLPVALGSAGNFVVLAGSTVTNTGLSSVTGDLGVSPGTAVTGFPPGTLVGAMHAGTPTAAQAIADLTIAYNDAAGRTLCPVSVAGNLGGQTLAPGLYKSTSSLEISSGNLTLDAQGDGDAVFIFQMASTLTTTAGRQVVLSGGARATNVFWQVGTSATLGTTSAFQGTIMADQSITLNTGATLNGRVLARIAAVSLDANTIVKPAP